ncbi:MAG: hypothetical protein LBD20_09670, partial [Spirochaetaceae bacterium]|nr:hypothetical protein [Spirochaetaceae bacterium]
LFSLDDFYDAAASVHGIIVKKVISGGPDIPLPTAMIGGSDTNNVVKTGLKDGDSIQFSVIFDEAAAMPSGKSLSSVKYHVNTNPAVTLTNADISYPQVQGSSTYTANFTLSVPSGLDDLYKVEVEVQAPDRVTTKTYTYTFAAAMLGTSTYYPSVKGAVTAAAGTAAVPDVITVLADIAMDSGNNLTIGSVKYIKLTSELGQTRTLKRAAGNTGSPLISMSAGELTLENIIVDGGAVWSGSTPPWGGQPSPAHDATNNTGAGGINAVMPLIRAYGMGAKLTLGSDAVLRNNNNTTDINESSGGAVNARNGAVVIIDGGEVSRNQTFRIGGGIMLLGTSSAHTTLTLITGSINNNNVVNHDGGGIACEGANIEIHGGVISRNCAKYGGGINSWRGGDTSFNNTLTISDGVISDNIARIGEAAGGGGGVNASDGLQFFMSGGLITGNTSPLGNGIFVAAACDSFKMSNGARIAANNDVYLTTGKAITIDGDLTEATPVATITPELPLTDGRQVLSGTTYLTPANIAKFAVSASGWTISDRMGEMGNIYGNRAASRVVSGTATYYDSLTAALAAAGGTVSSPDEITVLTNITLAAVPSEHYISNKHIKLISGGVQRTIKRGTGSEWAPLFTVQANASLTLENIVIDGGAVWASGSHAPGEPPSPATGANNTGITTNKCLIMVEGTNAKLILNADAVIQNNDNTDTQIGGSGIRVHGSTSEVRITSATAEVRYNKSSNSGGGIELDNGILVVSGKIHNNSAVGGGGGIKAAWNGSINISNGSITHNKTNTNGGGIYAHNFNGNFTMTAGTIAANTASNGGGIYLFTDNASTTFTMSGGIIGGSTAADANVATGGLGGGVYHNGNSFVISGTAQVTTNNAVYLPTGKTIAVGIITTTYTLAKIKPQNAAFGTQVLSGDSGYINANYNKFQLDESVTGRTIGSNGSLQ